MIRLFTYGSALQLINVFEKLILLVLKRKKERKKERKKKERKKVGLN